jgi:hypothetical protein
MAIKSICVDYEVLTQIRIHFFSGQTRIRQQIVVYFCLHRGQSAGKHRKLPRRTISHMEARHRVGAVRSLCLNPRGKGLNASPPTRNSSHSSLVAVSFLEMPFSN